MAGKIIADTIESAGSQISLNVGNVTVLTASSTGLTLIPTTNVNINLTNSIVNLTSGNVTNPSLTFSGNTSTGIFMPAANTIAFGTAGSEDMRITATGILDIGGSSGGGTGELLVVEGANSAGHRAARINNTGTTNGYSTLWMGSSNDGLIRGGSTAGSFTDQLAILTSGATPVSFYTNNTERMRIDTGGQLLLSTTSSTIGGDGGRLLIDAGASSLALLANRTGDGNMVRWYRTNVQVGSIGVTASATSYNTSSDYRLKQNIVPMTGALAKVALLKPVTYKWKADESDGQGFIAHELAEVVPDCVTGEKDALKEDGNPDYQGVDTSFLVATLTAAIQELKAIVDAQAVEIAALKA
jgi:hypothetical protein